MTDSKHRESLIHLVATPIGNMDDLSVRARKILSDAPVVAAEDTRVARRLLGAIGAKPRKLVSVRGANEVRGAEKLADLAEAEGGAAYISDAGTPGISDPGSVLAATLRRRGIRIEPVPGPCAAVVAAGVSGMCAKGFMFAGFLPRKGGDRKRTLAAVAARGVPTVLYEAPTRMAATLHDLSVHCGPNAAACLCRELTKLHEQICLASLKELADQLRDGLIPAKGEFTLVVAPPDKKDAGSDLSRAVSLCRQLAGELPASKAASIAASHYGIPRSTLYDKAFKSPAADR